METWKDVPFNSDYQVSDKGRVKTKSRKIRYTHAVTGQELFRLSQERFLNTHETVYGYKTVCLHTNKKQRSYLIHRLVALAFIEGHFEGAVVNHKNGNKHDNTVENLEWCTDAYNHEHATITGLKPRGSRIASSKLDERLVGAIKQLLAQGFTHGDLATMFDVSRSAISLIAEGKSWKHVNALTGRDLTLQP